MKKALIICAAVVLFAVSAWADTVTFRSGKKIEGNIKAITNDTITVDIYGVTEMTYDLSEIQEINGQAVEFKPAVPPAEIVPAAANPVTGSMATPPSGPQEEKISGPSGKNPENKLSDKESKALLAVIIAFLMAFLGVIITGSLIYYIYLAVCLQVIAGKTDTQNGWMAWIPIANLFLACNIGNVRYTWLLLLLSGLIPPLGPLCYLFLFGLLWYKIALARGKEGWIGIITVIPVVGLFTMGYLAFSKKEEGAAPAPNIGGGQPANPLGTAPTYKPPLE
ncbi:MAG: hypothetical protein PHX64_03975 [Candidatus Omnitrophica bacterium]|nr:hypothetical protein [Candidatus Omnitrophota bacterium]MDD5310892.1 hypothetical protein [Candidatus Omnitrophota bacterium]MDD5546387.1 hypothetical protein [Candidatus Omnitrophota bacterium]